MDPLEGLRAAMAAVDAYYKERGIFQGRFGFGASPALVVIDMAYGWTDGQYAGGSARLDTAVAAIRVEILGLSICGLSFGSFVALTVAAGAPPGNAASRCLAVRLAVPPLQPGKR